MGCGSSKLDELPAVALCRERRAFLDEAIRRRFDFAEAHASYLHSLNSVALSLDRFFNHRKTTGSPPSDSGSHIIFLSDDDDASGSDSFHRLEATSPVHHHKHPYAGDGFMNISYMKNQTTPSLAYTQRPMSPEAMHMGDFSAFSSSSSSYNPYPNYAINQNYSNYGGGAVASSSKPPPPPPSPPRSSTWDFLNPFETFDKYYPSYTPTYDSTKAVREEEGIPDLEDDDDDEVVKKVHGNQKLVVDSKISGSLEDSGKMANDKSGMNGADKVKDRGNADEFKPRGDFKGDLEVVKEIQVQFERASECGSELAKFLEVGKLPYKSKRVTHHVSSKLLHFPMASLHHSITKSSDNGDPALLDVDQDVELQSKNLSSTLHKLYLWETKLYEEVKAEEKMRVLHEKRSRKMKRMDERCSEAHKVNEIKTFVRSLSTKIKIAIQVVDKISVKINTLRDDELWPQLNEFIQGLTTMWKSMLECHRHQCRAIREAKQLDAIAFQKHSSDSHFEATRQLEHDLVNWTLKFSHWVDAQKGYVRSLNNWLMKCLLYVPEETPDGIAPFSPGRIGAPQVFVICNQWSQLMDTISEKEVVDSMRDLASNVLQLWDRDKTEMRQRMLANKDERKIRSLEKEDLKVQKEIRALNKKMVLISAVDNGMPLKGHVVYPSETTKQGSLQASLQHVLEAMETFTANSLKIYEELLQRTEEDGHLASDHERVS